MDISKKKLPSQVSHISFSLKDYKGLKRIGRIKGIRAKMSYAKFMLRSKTARRFVS